MKKIVFIFVFLSSLNVLSQKIITPPNDCFEVDPDAIQWYRDSDGDGYGTALSTYCSVNKPYGYVGNFLDCDDTDPNITTSKWFYPDNDSDGYGAGTGIKTCFQPSGYVTNNDDCDDNNANLTIGITWYGDSDGDGFGDPNITTTSCLQPPGYVSNNNDNCPTEYGQTNGCPASLNIPDYGNLNYIYEETLQVPVSDINYNSVSNNDKLQSITYYDGLGRPVQNININAGGDKLNNNLLDWKGSWKLGSGSAPFFNQNGSTVENQRINGTDPHGNSSILWNCGNDTTSNADGGWNTNYFKVDNTVGYRYSVWVKRTGSQNGTTYHGTQNVNNLSGTANSNPYFWAGDTPQLNQWYLLVGVIHPYNYSGGNSGISGVYDINGNQVITGTDFKWSDSTTTSRFRSYLYYATDTNVRQYFYDPIVQKLDGNEASIQEIIQGHKGKDIVTHIEYDANGRQNKEYLPFASENNGMFNSDAYTKTLSYYNILKYENTTNPYTEKVFDGSPLNRVLETGAPGMSWKVDASGDLDHTIKMGYATNSATDELHKVKLYKVSLDSGDTPTLINPSPNYYPVNTLFKTIVKDENWTPSSGKLNTTEEFKNKFGQLILKRTYALINSVITPLDTYYVYDDYNNLTYIIPPKANDQLFIETTGYEEHLVDFYHSVFTGVSGGGSVKVSIIGDEINVTFNAGFQSTNLISTPQELNAPCNLPDMFLGYIQTSPDYGNTHTAAIENGKLVLKDLYGLSITGFSGTLTKTFSPDCTDPVTNYVVDNNILDELGFQYKYDKYNRVVEKKVPGKDWEYLVYDNMDRVVLTQDGIQRAKSTKEWLFSKYDAFGRVVYTGLYKDNRGRIDVQTSVDGSSPKYETKGSALFNYTNNAFPNNISSVDVRTVNYYDDYNFNKPSGLSSTVNSYGITSTLNTNGLATGSKIRVLGTNNWVTTVSYYDDKARPIYNYSENEYLGSVDIVESKLDFSGKITETTTRHTKNSNTITTIDKFEYDHTGRLISQRQSVNALEEEVIVKNSYDELGKLIRKDVGGKISQFRLQSVDYSYNIRGWLKSINNVDNIGNDLFTFKLNYDSVELGATNQSVYNGNISETIWKTANDISSNKTRAYAYSYDALNRITYANYGVKTTGSYNLNSGFDMKVSNYDKNGNILSLWRDGISGKIDQLTYNYYNNGNSNKLLKVDDASGTDGFKNGSGTSTEYTYDANGNMITDANKGITGITYNHLNLPTLVTLASGNITYIYNALGVKLKKIVTETGKPQVITEYAGNYVYENGNLQFFNQPEGFVEKNGSIFKYVYQYKDHLGNVRLNYADNNNNGSVDTSEILEENNYYPFGLKHKGYNNGIITEHPYKYNGKELNKELSLNWYDYGARNYDAALGRWMNIDPMAEKAPGLTPYRYAFNNPVNIIDPDGNMESEPSDIGGASASNSWYGNGASNYYEFGEGASINGDGTVSGKTKGCCNSEGNIYVVRYPNGEVNIISAKEYNKLVKSGIKQESFGEFESNVNEVSSGVATDISQAGLDFIASYEGYSSTVYKDVAGLKTIGYGHLIKPGEDFSNGVTKAQALTLLRQDAQFAVNAVNRYVTVSLNQNQFDALTSFTFNVGGGALRNSTLLRMVNAGNLDAIPNSFMMWNKARVNGVLTPVQGLTNRRTAESNLYINGTY